MAVYSKTLTQLRHELAKYVDDYIVATADASTSTTSVVDAEIGMYNTDHFNGFEICGYALTGALTAKVTDFAVTSGVGTLTIVPAMTGMAVGVAYELHNQDAGWSKVLLDAAVNWAINRLGRIIALDKIDESLTLAAATYEYSIPSGFISIRQIYLETSTAGRFYTKPISDRLWRIVDAATPQIAFDPDDFSITTSRKLQIHGQQLQAELSAEASTCALPPHIVLDLALSHLKVMKGDIAEALALEERTIMAAQEYRQGITPGSRIVNV